MTWLQHVPDSSQKSKNVCMHVLTRRFIQRPCDIVVSPSLVCLNSIHEISYCSRMQIQHHRWLSPSCFCIARFPIPIARALSHICSVSRIQSDEGRDIFSFQRRWPTLNCIETDAGIGHQLTELMASMATALIIPGATFVYQNNTNWDKLVYRHGSLAWAEEFFR